MSVAVSDEKLLEVARFVGSRMRRENREEATQIAYLVGHDWRDRYGHKNLRQPFTFVSKAAFRRTALALRRQAAVVSVSEGAATGRVKNGAEGIFFPCPISDRTRFGADDDVPEIGLRGERERAEKTARLLRSLEPRGKKLILHVMRARDERNLKIVARRVKLPPLTARSILQRFVNAVGQDPIVAHIRIMLREPGQRRA